MAIPYFTGIVVFVGNIVSKAAAIRNWQDTVISLALEKLQTLLEPYIPQIISELEKLIGILENIDAGIHSAEGSLFAGITIEKRSMVLEKLQKLLRELSNSIARNDADAVASTAVTVIDKAATGLRAAQRSSSEINVDALQQEFRVFSQLGFRKLKESEIVALFSNLWASIRCLPISLIQINKLIFLFAERRLEYLRAMLSLL